MPAPLPMDTRVRIASALVEGNSIRAVARMVDVDKGTVMALALRLGEGCIRFHNRKVRGLACGWTGAHGGAFVMGGTAPAA